MDANATSRTKLPASMNSELRDHSLPALLRKPSLLLRTKFKPVQRTRSNRRNGVISRIIEKHYLHFNAAALTEAAKEYRRQLADGNRMLITLDGALSPAELGISLAELIRRDKVHMICC